MALGISAEELETSQKTAFLVTYADSNATALDIDTSSWSVCEGWVDIPDWANGLKVMFYAYDPNDPNDDTLSYEFYVADYGGNAQKVASGSATVGKSQLSHDPVSLSELNSGAVDPNYCWIDTLGTVTTDWKGGVSTQNDGGANDCSAFIFDRQNAKKAYCRIYGLSDYLNVWCVAYGY